MLAQEAPRIRWDGKRVAGPSLGRFATVGALQRDVLGFFEASARDHGDFVRFNLPLGPGYLLGHSDLIEEVLVKQHERFHKDLVTQELGYVLGKGLLTNEGEPWKRQRKLAAPSLSKKHVGLYADTMVRLSQRSAAGLTVGAEVDAHQVMMQLTLQIVVETLFGLELHDDVEVVGAALETTMHYFDKVSRSLKRFIPRWVPTAQQRALRRATRTLDAVVYRLIEEKRRTPGGDDLLSMLIAAVDDDGTGMTDVQLRDEVITMFLAGHETTAIALSYAVWQLAQRPDVEAKLLAELDAVLGGRTAKLDDYAKLTYTQALISETMRLYPPAWAFGRQAQEAVQIAGVSIAKRAQVWISPWVIHRDPRWFDAPLELRPERWLGGLRERLPRFAYLPFGGGPRVCIGNHFAMMEAVLALATVYQHVRFELSPTHQVGFITSATLRPAHGIRVRVAERAGRPAEMAVRSDRSPRHPIEAPSPASPSAKAS